MLLFDVLLALVVLACLMYVAGFTVAAVWYWSLGCYAIDAVDLAVFWPETVLEWAFGSRT
jgi:hypothetical protein